mmetsp:Transcript_6644/g.14495  ORF Transcript_6644/g.14495 Transcript_6644/m.14495 type:complete len:241 (+) Transcript_6644:103-825(+)
MAAVTTPRGALVPHGKRPTSQRPRPGMDARTALAWHLYFTDMDDLARRGVTKFGPQEYSAGEAQEERRPQVQRFAELARQARPAIRSALGVLLGADFENQAASCAEVCQHDLLTFRAMLTQAGCDLQDTDTYLVEMLFAAATTSHGRIQCKLLKESHAVLVKSNFEALLDEDIRWRRPTSSRGSHSRAEAEAVTPPRPKPPARPQSSATCRCERQWPEWSLSKRGSRTVTGGTTPRPVTR